MARNRPALLPNRRRTGMQTGPRMRLLALVSGTALAALGARPANAQPNPPSNLRFDPPDVYSVVLRWDDNSAHEDGFRVARLDPGEDPSNFSQWDNAAVTGPNVTSVRIEGLAPTSTYQFKVRAYRDTNYSEYSNTVIITTGSPLPATPGNFRADPADPFSVIVRWDDNSPSAGFPIPENGFSVARLDEGEDPNIFANWDHAASTGANGTSVRVESLAPANRYWFRVRAHNDTGYSAYSNTIEVVTPAAIPAMPTNLWADPPGASSVVLRWTDSSPGPGFPIAEDSFDISQLNEGEDPDDPAHWDQVAMAPANATSVSISGLPPCVRYWFRVRAHNANGYSAYSNSVEVNLTSAMQLSLPDSAFMSGCANDTISPFTSVMIRNTGACPAAVNISANGPGFFVEAGGGSVTLAPNEPRYVSVGFQHSAFPAGSYEGRVHVAPGFSFVVRADVVDPATVPVSLALWYYYNPPPTPENPVPIPEWISESLSRPLVVSVGVDEIEAGGPVVRRFAVENFGCPVDCPLMVAGTGATVVRLPEWSPGALLDAVNFQLVWLPPTTACPGQWTGTLELCAGVHAPLTMAVLDNSQTGPVLQAAASPFVPVGCGETSVSTIQIRNTSTTCSVPGVATVGSEANFRILTGAGPYLLAPGGVRDVVIEFDPHCELGPADNQATLEYLTGSWIQLVASTTVASSLSIEPGSWTIGPVYTVVPRQENHEFALRNDTPWPHIVTASVYGGAYFSVVAPPVGVSIGSGESLPIQVRWNYPGGIELRDSGQLRVEGVSSFGTSEVTASLSATALGGDARWVVPAPGGVIGVARPSSGDVITGTLSLCHDGPTAITRSVSLQGDGFALIGGPRDVVVPANGCVEIAVSFSATSAASWHDAMASSRASDFLDSDAVDLWAYVGDFLVWPGALSFGNVPAGQSATQNVTITAPQHAPLSLTVVQTPCAPFTYLGPVSLQLPAGGSADLSIQLQGSPEELLASFMLFSDGTPLAMFANVEGVVADALPGASATLPPPRLLVSPNPAAGIVVFGLEGGAVIGDAVGRLEIFDVRGRRVFTQDVPLGGRAWAWDRRDSGGAAVAAGIYHVRVALSGGAISAKLVLR